MPGIKVMGFCIILQPEVTMFGPHDTSRVSESDLHQCSRDGKLNLHVQHCIWDFNILAH